MNGQPEGGSAKMVTSFLFLDTLNFLNNPHISICSHSHAMPVPSVLVYTYCWMVPTLISNLMRGLIESNYFFWQKEVERIRRIPSHGVAALRAFGIEQGNPFRDCIDSLLIDLEE